MPTSMLKVINASHETGAFHVASTSNILDRCALFASNEEFEFSGILYITRD